MGRKKTGLDRRILKEADRLFYKQGYTNTGISQIVSEAGTNKPGLYSYFEGKDDLARQYLDHRNDLFVNFIISKGDESKSVADFFKNWMLGVKEMALGNEYFGCPVANFAMQTDTDDRAMFDFIYTISKKWYTRLVAYLRKEMKAGRFQSKLSADAIARRMLMANEGAIAMWKLTGQVKYFDEGIRMFQDSIEGA